MPHDHIDPDQNNEFWPRVVNFLELYLESSMAAKMPLVGDLPIIKDQFEGILPWQPIVAIQFQASVIQRWNEFHYLGSEANNQHNIELLTDYLVDLAVSFSLCALIDHQKVTHPVLVMGLVYNSLNLDLSNFKSTLAGHIGYVEDVIF